MALASLQVFDEWVRRAVYESLKENFQLFNAATNGALILTTKPFAGDYKDTAFWANMGNMVRRRNAYSESDDDLDEMSLSQLLDTMVKVAAGTQPIRLDPGQFNWIKVNPKAAAVVVAKQVAEYSMLDMVTQAVQCFITAISNDSDTNVYDDSVNANINSGKMHQRQLLQGQALFGDQAAALKVWLMHSVPLNDMYDSNLQNLASLFSYGSVNVKEDPFGRRYIQSDLSTLKDTATINETDTTIYHTLGLTAGAVTVSGNDDFDQMTTEQTGKNNLRRVTQSEWSFNIGVKGYAWDKTNGGASPTDAALATATNWDKNVDSAKSLGGVDVITL